MAKAILNWESRIGRRLKLRDLHILFTVVQWGSMAKGATHLGMSQPAVSEAIASLEDALRVRLLDRSPRGIEPTIYADALLKRGHIVFDELKQGIRDIEFLADPTAGELRARRRLRRSCLRSSKACRAVIRAWSSTSPTSWRRRSICRNCATAASMSRWYE